MPRAATSHPKPALPTAIRRRLEQPAIAATEFTPTTWDGAAAKAKFAQQFLNFLAQGMAEHLFTQTFYRRLSLCFGHIAHYNRHGFLDHYFRTSSDRRRFLQDSMGWIPVGDPAWTWCDVELALQRRIRDSGLLEHHGLTCRPTSGRLARPLWATKPPAATALPADPGPVMAPQGDLFASPGPAPDR